MQAIEYRTMQPGEEQAVCELVARVFNEFVAADLEQDGIDEFFRFANPDAMRDRQQSDGFVLVAVQANQIVGMLEFIQPDRIAMLFVSLRQQGIGAQLLARAISRLRTDNPLQDKLTVNSSIYAEPMYCKMGFQPTGALTSVNGIQFIPMQRMLRQDDI